MATTELTGAEGVAWDLSDLYEGIDDPRIEADVARAEADAAAFRERYHGTVAGLDAGALADAIAEYERIESALVRPLTFAHLVFATNMADPARGALVALDPGHVGNHVSAGARGDGRESRLGFGPRIADGLRRRRHLFGLRRARLRDPSLAARRV